MSTDKLDVKFTCKNCGGTIIELPDNATDDSIARCKNCGVEFGRWGEIKSKATEKARDHLVAMTKDAFKGIKGFRPK